MYIVSLRPKCTLLYQLLKNVNLDVYYFLNLDVLLKPSMEELYQTELRKKKQNIIEVYWVCGLGRHGGYSREIRHRAWQMKTGSW